MAWHPEDIVAARRRLLLRSEKALGLESVTWREDEPPGPRSDRNTRSDAASPRETTADAPERAPRSGVASESPRASSLFGEVRETAPPVADRPEIKGAALPAEEKRQRLTVLDETQVTGCTRCPLHETRTQTVFGEGDVDAPIVFVGEGPGQNEDETGRPFVGRAGELLNKMIAGMGLSRERVFIANVVKCRPPNNRTPTAQEVATCTPYLDTQLETIRPTAIVTLGLPASQYLLGSKLSMSKLRGRWHDWRGIPLMPTYHPAYVLRAYTRDVRQKVWDDLRMVMERLEVRRPD